MIAQKRKPRSSEQDFHQLFAEAVIAGQPGQQDPIEITTGLARIGLHDKVKPGWALNPTLSHYIRNDNTMKLSTNNAKTNVPIKTQLSQARSRDEVFDILKDAFIIKLSALYQLPIDDLAKEDPSNLKLHEMGTDSLLAHRNTRVVHENISSQHTCVEDFEWHNS